MLAPHNGSVKGRCQACQNQVPTRLRASGEGRERGGVWPSHWSLNFSLGQMPISKQIM